MLTSVFEVGYLSSSDQPFIETQIMLSMCGTHFTISKLKATLNLAYHLLIKYPPTIIL